MTKLTTTLTAALATTVLINVCESTVDGKHPVHMPAGVTLTANSSVTVTSIEIGGHHATTHDWEYRTVQTESIKGAQGDGKA
jgi:hypothetical protein